MDRFIKRITDKIQAHKPLRSFKFRNSVWWYFRQCAVRKTQQFLTQSDVMAPPETSRSVSSEMWTPEEHGQLAKLYDRWAEINIHMPGRTAEMCRSYWMLQFIPASTAPGVTASGKNEMTTVLHEPPSPGIDRARERWTEEEDRALVQSVREVGSMMDLGPFESFVSDSSELDRRERWIFILDPCNKLTSCTADDYRRFEQNHSLA